MKNYLFIIISAFTFLFIQTALASDFEVIRDLKHPNSQCLIKKGGTDNGYYRIERTTSDSDIIYETKVDGIDQLIFSPTGRFIAIASSELGLFDAKKYPEKATASDFIYGLVIVDCSKESVVGLRKEHTSIKWWWKDDDGLSFKDGRFLRLPRKLL